ncbi:MAG TPA: hypothetical protein PLC49_06360 [Caldisericia bacterium]|nr:hypothetical protein [Caldisericia bacterium]
MSVATGLVPVLSVQAMCGLPSESIASEASVEVPVFTLTFAFVGGPGM